MKIDLSALEVNTPQLLAAALDYAERNWPVAPAWWITPGGECACPAKARCPSPGKHPRTKHGLKDASCDQRIIRAWWREAPYANILLATGEESGFDVLDVDVLKGGDDGLAKLVAQHGPLPDTVESLTGGGGRHLLFVHADGVSNSPGTLPPGIDVRGTGGYIIAPPSYHRSGNQYAWELSGMPGEVPVAAWPAWLLDMICRARAPQDAGAMPSGPIPTGKRNQRLLALVGAARRQGASEEELIALARIANRDRCQPPLDDNEVLKVVHSAMRYTPTPDALFLRMFRTPDGRLVEEPCDIPP